MDNKKYFERDLSWLSFNERVLMEANNKSVPLFERIKFLAIYSSNLDEFFRVRVALIKRLSILNKSKLNAKTEFSSPKKLLKEIHKVVNSQQELFGDIFRNQILPELDSNNIHLYSSEEYKKEHKFIIQDIFYTKILSFIQPIIIPKSDTSPVFLNNGKLYTVSNLEKDGIEYIGIVKIPGDKIKRFEKLSDIKGVSYYTFIDDIIKQYLPVIFSGYTVKSKSNVKLNRDAELFLSDDFSVNVIQKLKKSLSNREIGSPSRFLYEPGIDKSTLTFLKTVLDLQEDDCVSGGAYHKFDDLFSLPNPIGSKLENPPLNPLTHYGLDKVDSIFDVIAKKDIFLSFPYQKYDYILRLFNEAAIDPSIISIKATLYRVAEDSYITNALISAVRNGKKVSVLVEAKARFDEENNLKWADEMKAAGVVVKFSSQELKVHSKIAIFHRKVKDSKIQKFAFLGTGNFNEGTARFYTDYALLTSNSELTDELDDTIDFALGSEMKKNFKHLLVAKINMTEKFIELIDNEIKAATKGDKAQIILKLNNLQDDRMIDKLYEAADSGVKIEIIIRGICCLIPRKNIQLTRIVDQFLEHARVYIFHNSGEEKIYVGSADWMKRNLKRRIEVAFPLYDKNIRELVMNNISLQLKDNTKAVIIDDNLQNIKVKNKGKLVRAQNDFYNELKIKSNYKSN